MNRLPISVCIIAGEEAGKIARAIESVKDWTQEVVLVVNDTVADGTDKVAATLGAKVYLEKWKGHIRQKNSSAEKATQDWILAIDADEAVSDSLRDEIISLFKTKSARLSIDGFSMPRCTNYYGRWIRHGDWYPDRKVRLWRRGKGKWGGIDPHDKLEVAGQVGVLKNDLLHFTAETIEHQLSKTIAYAEDFAKNARKEGKTASWADLLFRPGWRFFRGYVLKAGFLDGWQGYAISSVAAFYTFLRYFKVFVSTRGHSK